MVWKTRGFWSRLFRLFHVRKTFGLLYRLLKDKRVPSLNKGVFGAAVLIYVFLPVDLIPDFFPFLGQLDDLAAILFFIDQFIALAPAEVVEEYEKARF